MEGENLCRIRILDLKNFKVLVFFCFCFVLFNQTNIIYFRKIKTVRKFSCQKLINLYMYILKKVRKLEEKNLKIFRKLSNQNRI